MNPLSAYVAFVIAALTSVYIMQTTTFVFEGISFRSMFFLIGVALFSCGFSAIVTEILAKLKILPEGIL